MILECNSLFNVPSTPPQELIPWLYHQDSLTEKLQALSNHTALKILTEQWKQPCWWSRHVLQWKSNLLWQREILMFSQEVPCWYAKTLIPETTYQSKATYFARLQQESLGKLIFQNSQIQRTFLQVYAIDFQCLEFYWLPPQLRVANEPLFVRLSGFQFADGNAFNLVEILLPGLIRVIHEMA